MAVEEELRRRIAAQAEERERLQSELAEILTALEEYEKEPPFDPQEPEEPSDTDLSDLELPQRLARARRRVGLCEQHLRDLKNARKEAQLKWMTLEAREEFLQEWEASLAPEGCSPRVATPAVPPTQATPAQQPPTPAPPADPQPPPAPPAPPPPDTEAVKEAPPLNEEAPTPKAEEPPGPVAAPAPAKPAATPPAQAVIPPAPAPPPPADTVAPPAHSSTPQAPQLTPTHSTPRVPPLAGAAPLSRTTSAACGTPGTQGLERPPVPRSVEYRAIPDPALPPPADLNCVRQGHKRKHSRRHRSRSRPSNAQQHTPRHHAASGYPPPLPSQWASPVPRPPPLGRWLAGESNTPAPDIGAAELLPPDPIRQWLAGERTMRRLLGADGGYLR
eukprot:Hpha_TRINITY_DN19542_c0_g1::TRINITY_DN19542_c0_g1_i1::g.33632::m.33632